MTPLPHASPLGTKLARRGLASASNVRGALRAATSCRKIGEFSSIRQSLSLEGASGRGLRRDPDAPKVSPQRLCLCGNFPVWVRSFGHIDVHRGHSGHPWSGGCPGGGLSKSAKAETLEASLFAAFNIDWCATYPSHCPCLAASFFSGIGGYVSRQSLIAPLAAGRRTLFLSSQGAQACDC